MKNLAEQLGTKDRAQQGKRVQQLLALASMPVIDIIVRYDPRTDTVGITTIGANLPGEQIQHILAAARDLIHRNELDAARKLSTSKGEENA